MSLFLCSDPDNEIPDDQKRRIEDLSEEIIDSCAEIAETPEEALHAICAASAFVLSTTLSSKESAVHSLQIMLSIIFSSLSQAEEDGNVKWTTRHH